MFEKVVGAYMAALAARCCWGALGRRIMQQKRTLQRRCTKNGFRWKNIGASPNLKSASDQRTQSRKIDWLLLRECEWLCSSSVTCCKQKQVRASLCVQREVLQFNETKSSNPENMISVTGNYVLVLMNMRI
jgi:hypothetical protein